MRINTKTKLLLATAMNVTVMVSLSTPANAQIDEIVVTARKRVENAQQVPIAITAVTEAQLDKIGSTDVVDLTNSVPNFAHNGSGNVLSAVGIRGIVAATRNIGFESGMGVYVDEIYVGRPSAFNQNLDDVQQVEVLRGPQGTLFGRNTVAGALNITTKKPTNELDGKVKVTLGDRGRVNLSGFVSGPIVKDTVYAKVSAYSVKRNGYVENEFDGVKLNNEDRKGYRASLMFTPNDNLEIVLSADNLTEETNRAFTVFRQSDSTSPLFGLYNGLFANNACCSSTRGPNVTNQNAGPVENRDLSGQSLRAAYELESGHSLISLTSRRDTDFFLIADDDTTPLTLSHSTFGDQSELFTQEFRVESPATDLLDYVVGVYYQNTDSSSSRMTEITTPGAFNGVPNVTNGAGRAITDAAGNIVTAVGAITSAASVDAESYAVFGSMNYQLSDPLKLTVGLRYTSEEKSLDFMQMNTSFTGAPDVTAMPEIEDSGLSGNVSLAYAVNEDVNIYVSAARGFKSGGFNPDIVPNDDISFGEEVVNTFEAGLKSSFMDNKVRLNAAAFFTDYKDQQVQRLGTSPTGGTGFQITNADSEILGAEFELTVNPIENLILNASLGLLDHEYTDFDDCSATEDNQQSSPGQFVLINCDGNKLSYVPDVTYAVSAEYSVPFTYGELYGRIAHNFKDSQFSEPGNFARTAVPDSKRTDLRVGFRDKNDRFELAAWGKNIGDREDLQFSWYIPAFQTSYQSYGIGSEYGVDFIVNF